MLLLEVKNISTRKRLYHSGTLRRLAEKICAGEGLAGPAELSLLLCDNARMAQLNRDYRGIHRPTDVLSFAQEAPARPTGPRVLGDIVVSLEYVETQCEGNRATMREELRLLFCHGLLHLLGYDHASARAERRMLRKQSEYLNIPLEAAWRHRN